MTPVLAALPLLLVLVAMGAGGLSAAAAGSIGLAVALFLAFAAAGFGFDGPALPALGGTAAEAAFSTLTILWIIFPALALYEYQSRSGAIARIRDALTGLTGDRRLQAVLIAWFFGLFIEGAAGFGTPVALAAPLLAGLGYPPVRAVALALLGHAAGVSFGAVGTPTLVQVDLTGLAPTAISGPVATMHAILGPVLLLSMMRLAGDGPLTGRDLRWAGVAALAFIVPSLALAWTIGPELPSLGGAFIGGAAFVWLLLRAEHAAPPDVRRLLPDLLPYLIILALVLATRLLPGLQDIARAPAIDWTLAGTFRGRFEPLYHPGTLLLLGLALGALLTGRGTAARDAMGPTLARLLPVALALLAMLALSRVMVHGGLITALAEAAAALGPFWPLAAPLLGVAGTFVTGSATASNILFTELQTAAAAALSLPPAALAAAQGFGSAIGNVVAPHNIIAGSATVGLTNEEGPILRQTLAVAALYTALGGALALALARLL
ncbi:MAG: L-lactate permease [Paracoccaceae bacterium]|nr:L-lactate permease [Paracoccaceae bacterium]